MLRHTAFACLLLVGALAARSSSADVSARPRSSMATPSSSPASGFGLRASTLPRSSRPAPLTASRGRAATPRRNGYGSTCSADRSTASATPVIDTAGYWRSATSAAKTSTSGSCARAGRSPSGATRPPTCRRNRRPSAPAPGSGAASSPRHGSGGSRIVDANQILKRRRLCFRHGHDDRRRQERRSPRMRIFWGPFFWPVIAVNVLAYVWCVWQVLGV